MGLQRNRICLESNRLWEIAGPIILQVISQYSLEFVTASFVGHLGTLDFAAVSVIQNVVLGFVYGVMLGMGSALETLCGQAVGAGNLNMLGVYMQRSWIITLVTSLLLTPVFIYASPLLKLLHQDKAISDLAGKFALWILPQMFSFALNFPILKFLQSQSRVWVAAFIAMGTLVFHVLLNWVFLVKLRLGLVGAAVAGDISCWLIVTAQLAYIFYGPFDASWNGFSSSAFKSLTGFIKLSLASAVMLCLELWYFTAILLMVGGLKNPETAVDAVSICLNLEMWTLNVALGFNAAVSVRVSNELGANKPRAAKFSVVVATLTSLAMGVVFTLMIIASNKQFPKIFSDEPVVTAEATKLGYFLAATVLLDSVQLVLNGAAVGAGWQVKVALINIGCYYIVGLPTGALLGYKLEFGVNGIWSGMLLGLLLQTVVLLVVVWRTNWQEEALKAETRMNTWGGPSGPPHIALSQMAPPHADEQE